MALPKLTSTPFAIAANGFMIPTDRLAKQLVSLANQDEENAVYWLDRAIDTGLSRSFLKEVERKVENFSVPSVPKLSGNRFVWHRILIDPSGVPDMDAAFAMNMCLLINHGVIKKVHRCALDDCRTYFVGDSRSKWCSKSCGSKYRVRQKRLRDS